MSFEKMQTLLNDHQLYHSEFQMDYFIIGKAGGGTVYGQYKQTLRELFKRYRGLKQLGIERELLKLDISECMSTERGALLRTQKEMGLEDLERNIADTERELNHFYKRAEELKKEIGDLTAEKRNKLDREMWLYEIKCMAAVDYIIQKRLSPETLRILMALPKKLRAPLLDDVQRPQQKLIAWLDEQSGMEPE